MTTSRIAVSLPSGLVARVRRAVAQGRTASVSAYVAAALREKAKLDDLAQMLQQMLAGTGTALTAAERRAADEILGAGKLRKRRAGASTPPHRGGRQEA